MLFRTGTISVPCLLNNSPVHELFHDVHIMIKNFYDCRYFPFCVVAKSTDSQNSIHGNIRYGSEAAAQPILATANAKWLHSLGHSGIVKDRVVQYHHDPIGLCCFDFCFLYARESLSRRHIHHDFPWLAWHGAYCACICTDSFNLQPRSFKVQPRRSLLSDFTTLLFNFLKQILLAF